METILHIPDPEQVKPLIIVGQPRSGTRFLTNILNGHEKVTINGEIRSPIMKALRQLIAAGDREYLSKNDDAASRWRTQRAALVFSAWRTLQQSIPPRISADCRFYGYKTPRHEHEFDFYEPIFSTNPPYYLYCLRGFGQHYLSNIARWPNRSLESVKSDWKSSIRRLRDMHVAAPDRVFVFVLDRYMETTASYLRRLLDNIGIETSDRRLQRLIDRVARNSSREKRVPRREELTEQEKRSIEGDKDLAELFVAGLQLDTGNAR